MQPPAADIGNRQSNCANLLLQMFRRHRTDFFEHPAAILLEQLILGIRVRVVCVRQIAKIRADVTRKLCDRFGSHHCVGMRRRAGRLAFHHHGRADITKYEMRITITKIDLRRRQLGIDHQHAPSGTSSDSIVCSMQGEGRRGTSHQHVEAKSVDAELCLHLDRDGRVGCCV